MTLLQPSGASAFWRREPSVLQNDVCAILAAADLAAEQTAARLRLGVLALIGLVLVSLGSLFAADGSANAPEHACG